MQKILSLVPYSLNTGITRALLVAIMGILAASALVICFTNKETKSLMDGVYVEKNNAIVES